eukprot:gene7555-8392_t
MMKAISFVVIWLAICSNVASRTKDNALYDFDVDLDDLINSRDSTADNSKNDPNVLDVAAFNVRVFGRTKMSKTFVVQQLVKIILRYDLILIQEIRDSSETAIFDLLSKVNAASTSFTYGIAVSSRLGRTSSKEQYAYLYNQQMLTVDDHYVYDDSAKDIFQREPFVVKFTSTKLAMPFAVIGIHTAPSDAATEIDHLVDVYESAKLRWGISDVILMGDFNAGCTYVSDWSKIRLATDRRFYWLINDITDTTAGSTECAYDRIVVAGDQLLKAIDPLSPQVFHYDTEYALTPEQSLSVSDHYPVSVQIRTSEEVQNVKLTRKFEVDDTRTTTATSRNLNEILTRVTDKGTYSVAKFYDMSGRMLFFIATRQSSNLAQSSANLDVMKTDFSPLITDVQVSAAKRHLKELSMIDFLPKNNGFFQTLKDYCLKKTVMYGVEAKCTNQTGANPICTILGSSNGGV